MTILTRDRVPANALLATAVGSGQSGLWLPRRNVRRAPQPTSILTTFQSGHGWTSSGAGLVLSDDTSDFTIGTQSLLCTGTTTTARQALSPASLALDLTGLAIELIFKVTGAGANNLDYMAPAVSTDGTTFFAANPRFNGGSNFPVGDEVGYQRIILPQAVFATGATWNNINRIRIEIDPHATSPALQVRLQRVAFVPAPTVGPIFSFTFDDSYLDSYTVYNRKLAQYGYPATAYLIANQVADTVGARVAGRLVVPEARELQDGFGWQMACHADTQAHHDDATMFSETYGYDTMERSFEALRHWMAAKGFDGAEDFAYGPYTINTDAGTRNLVKQYFRSARMAVPISASPVVRVETPRPVQPHGLANAMWSGSTTTQFAAWVDQVVAAKGWGISLNHASAGSSSGLTIGTADFATNVDKIHSVGGKVMTVGDVLENGLW